MFGSIRYVAHIPELFIVAQFIAVKSITTLDYWGEGGCTLAVPPLQYGWIYGMCFPAAPGFVSALHNTCTGKIFSTLSCH